MPSSGTPVAPEQTRRGYHWKICLLAALGTLLLAATLTVRVLDRPRDVQPIDYDEESYYSQFFGVGMDEGSFENLGCSGYCPITLSLYYNPDVPNSVGGLFQGALEGTQAGTEPARIILITLPETSDFSLTSGTNPSVKVATRTIALSPNSILTNHGEEVTITELTLSSLDNGYFGVEFDLYPDDALTAAGLGRRNLRLAYHTNHPALGDLQANSLDIADLENSLTEIAVEVDVSHSRIGDVKPEPRTRPDPDSVAWRAGTDSPVAYYVVTVDDAGTRFWVGIINEQTLFIAGLLLGAVIGAVASGWFTSGVPIRRRRGTAG
jgi:hypothetical protein